VDYPFTKKLSNANNFAVMYFLLAGGLYFFYYALKFQNYWYIPLVIAIYLFGFVLRTLVFKTKNNELTEPGMFFLAAVLLAYLLYTFRLDPNLTNYLPDKLVAGSGICFIVLVTMGFLPSQLKTAQKIFVIIAFLILIISSRPYQSALDGFLLANPWILKFVIGTPILYLVMLTTGVKGLFTTKKPA